MKKTPKRSQVQWPLRCHTLEFMLEVRTKARGARALLCCAVFFACTSGDENESDENSGEGGNAGETGGSGSGAAPGPDTPTRRLSFVRLHGQSSKSATDFVFLRGRPTSHEVLQLDREGHLAHLSLNDGRVELVRQWTFAEEIVLEDACVPSNLALDPLFLENGFVYVTYCPDERHDRLVRYRWDEEAGPVEPATIFEIELEEPGESWHRFGSMGFENQDVLWLFSGDHFLRQSAQDASSPMGSLLRLIPERDEDGGFRIPKGNLLDRLGDQASVHPLVSSLGFRSPWRATRDGQGRFWVGDVGSDQYEELNRVTGVGQNFGWPTHEGTCSGGCATFVQPTVAYGYDENHPYFEQEPGTLDEDQRAIWVGEMLLPGTPDRFDGKLDGVVVFGDMFTGFVRGLVTNSSGEVLKDVPLGVLQFVAAWRVAPDGRIFVLNLNGDFFEVRL